MKVGQMASYLDDGLPEPVRQALAAAAGRRPADERRAGRRGHRARARRGRPSELFVEWDPEPIAAASIGQVHRAVVVDPSTGAERAVAVKVQYPGVGEAIEADLANTDLLGTLLRQGFGGLDPDEMVAEIKERLTEELDYRREAAQPDRASPTSTAATRSSTCPPCCRRCRPARVLTSELVVGAHVAGGARRGTSTSATSPARRCSGSCSAACTGCTRSTATRTPATTCSTATAGSRSSTSGSCATSATPR